jgi:hypothetical protein
LTRTELSVLLRAGTTVRLRRGWRGLQRDEEGVHSPRLPARGQDRQGDGQQHLAGRPAWYASLPLQGASLMRVLEVAARELLVAMCACGCGEVPPLVEYDRPDRGYSQGDRPRFVTGHNLRVQKRKARPEIITVQPPSYCECGCGAVTPLLMRDRDGRRRGERSRRLRGHATRRFGFSDGLLFDECDRELVLSAAWHLNNTGYAQSKRLGLLHRVITNAPEGSEVDHVNGNRLDDRRCNLRLVTHQENQQNRVSPSRSNTGRRGVRFEAERGRFRARATVDGRDIFIGRFLTHDAAVEAHRIFCEQHTKGYVAR